MNHADKVPLSNLAQEFVRESIKHRQKKRRNWFIFWFVLVMAVILVFAGSAFYANGRRIVAEEQRIEAERQKDAAENSEKYANEQREVAEERRMEVEKQRKVAEEQAQITLVEKLVTQSNLAAQSLRNGYYEHALLLAVQAFKVKDNGTSRSNLLRILQTKKNLQTYLYGHSDDEAVSIAVNHDGKMIASGSRDGTIRLWNIKTKKQIGKPLTGHNNGVNSVAFSPNGKKLVSGGNDHTVGLWNIKTQELLSKLTEHSGSVSSVAFSPDGKIIASGSWDWNIRLWDADTLKPLGKPLMAGDEVTKIIISADNKMLISLSFEDNMISLWDIESRKQIDELECSSSNNDIFLSPNGKILASYDENIVCLWDVKTRKLMGILTEYSFYIHSVLFSPDSKMIIMGHEEYNISLWNVKTQTKSGNIEDYINSVAFDSGNKILYDGRNKTILYFWNLDFKNRLIDSLIKHSPSSSSIAFNPDGKIIAFLGEEKYSNDDNYIYLIDFESKKIVGKSLKHFDRVNKISFSPDGKILALASGKNYNDYNIIYLWDVESKKIVGKPLSGHSQRINSIAFSHNGKILASGSDDTSICLWDVKLKKLIDKIPLSNHSHLFRDGSPHPINSISFSPNDDILAFGDSDGIVLWNIKFNKPLDRLPPKNFFEYHPTIYSIAFSPDGKILASAGGGEYDDDNSIYLWNVESRKMVSNQLIGHSSQVDSVVFSPDGKMLSSRSDNLQLWDVESKIPMGDPFEYSIYDSSFSTDSKVLAFSTSEWIYTLDVDPESWAKKACAIVNRNFSQEEWQKYMGSSNRTHEKTCPNLPKDTLGAIELTQQARQLLKEGKIEQAKAKFAQAREWDANVVFGDEGL